MQYTNTFSRCFHTIYRLSRSVHENYAGFSIVASIKIGFANRFQVWGVHSFKLCVCDTYLYFTCTDTIGLLHFAHLYQHMLRENSNFPVLLQLNIILKPASQFRYCMCHRKPKWDALFVLPLTHICQRILEKHMLKLRKYTRLSALQLSSFDHIFIAY